MARSLAELLELFGHTVQVETCPDNVPRLLGTSHFDIVFSDFRMPTLDGLELRRRIAGANAQLATRTVIMTGDTMARLHDGDPAGDGGPVHVLEKPFTAAAVKDLLAQVMRA